MKNEQAIILADVVMELAKKYDTCDNPKCNLVHAICGVMANKNYWREAIALANTKGFKNGESDY